MARVGAGAGVGVGGGGGEEKDPFDVAAADSPPRIGSAPACVSQARLQLTTILPTKLLLSEYPLTTILPTRYYHTYLLTYLPTYLGAAA